MYFLMISSKLALIMSTLSLENTFFVKRTPASACKYFLIRTTELPEIAAEFFVLLLYIKVVERGVEFLLLLFKHKACL